jgi:NAD(P)-dependent dehydrogenase (short-subunit alcohol dehydrogenase family)
VIPVSEENQRSVFVSGCSRGIGAAICRVFQTKGFKVFGVATRPEKPEWVDEYSSFDFKNFDQINECADFVRSIEPDILVNNAGINLNSPFLTIDPEIFLQIQQVNVLSPLLLSQAAIPGMLDRGWGRIVNISSIWGIISKSGRASYSASKFALDGITISLAAEYADAGILANCVSPGFTDTELTSKMLSQQELNKLISGVPTKRLAIPSEIANLVYWLSSEENTFVTGQNIAIDGGFVRV